MPRIRVLEAIAGSDFSWAPGDVVEVSEEAAASWADGHRAVLVDEDQEPGDRTPSAVHQEPLILGEDGEPLEVVAATIEDLEPSADAEGGPRWVRWSVTVRLPIPAPGPDPDSDLDAGTGGGPVVNEQAEDEQGSPPAPLFDPREHSNREVLAYLDTVGEEEAIRVLDIEATEGENRAGIRKNREAVLEAARLRDPAPRRQPDAAEVAADDSRGGGRGEQPETRDW
ncbi:hypothetical protein [Streptomyces sp. NBC_00035]|uniref:hypothetical protein n=1 Tax=Streptomyces sp. NBC_00035 TaxID=2903614 RepID=UPI0032537BE5